MKAITFAKMKGAMKRLATWARSAGCFVILDSNDSSVTLSRRLFRRMRIMGMPSATDEDKFRARIYVFQAGDTKEYAFAVMRDVLKYADRSQTEALNATQTAEIQYNQKYRCIGFETLVPTVSKIYWDYRIYGNNGHLRVKLSVLCKKTKSGMPYYLIPRPSAKSVRKVWTET